MHTSCLQDALDAYSWIIDNATELGADSQRIAVAGDSAGGNISAAVCLATCGGDLLSLPQDIAHAADGRFDFLEREMPPPPAAQLLIYPSVDLTKAGWEVSPAILHALCMHAVNAYIMCMHRMCHEPGLLLSWQSTS